jgi:hypothetical protein
MISLGSTLKNIPGWRTKRKIVVIESDDWGSIRMPSKEVARLLKEKGAKVEENRYTRFDSLECNDDLTALYEVLTSFKDSSGKHPVITGVQIVANPDFPRIRESGFQQYYFEPYTETLKRYSAHDQVYSLVREGICSRLFVPEFHGREHVNVAQWMNAIKRPESGERFAFDLELTGLSPEIFPQFSKSYQAAFDLEHEEELQGQQEIVESGLKLFAELFGYRARHFVPPNGPLHASLEQTLATNGIRYLQTARMFYAEPQGNGTFKKRFRYFGKHNSFGQQYFLRNSVFEPSEKQDFDWEGKCLREINSIFTFRKPVIITTHRVNYTGFIDERNRTRGLARLGGLLKEILKKWPDVEFLTSSELGGLIAEENK